MSLSAVKILGINITTSSKKEILEHIEKFMVRGSWFREKKKKENTNIVTIVTPNPEQIVLAQSNKQFARLLNRADVAIPDGIGLVMASRVLNAKYQMPNAKYKLQRIPGIELMGDLVKVAAKRRIPVALIGGYGDVAVKAFECLSRRTSGLTGWGMVAPEFKLDQPASPAGGLDQFAQFVTKKIQQTGVGIVFIGLGAPKQEYVIARFARECQMLNVKCQIVMMSVGGSFDMIAGRMPRAPLVIRSIGFEWAWRLFHEPWRWHRQLALITFAWLVWRERLKNS